MRISKPLLIIAAALLALVVLFVVLLRSGKDPGEDSGDAAADRERVSTDAPTDADQRSAAPTPRPEPSTRPEPGHKIRRIRDEEQRRQLLAGIAAAREIRERIARERRLAAGAEPADAGAAGTLSKQTIRDAVAAVIEDVKSCYDEQLKLAPDLGGKLVVGFEIVAEEGTGGVVDNVEIGDESDETISASRELTQCIVDTIYTLELPEPEGGGVVEVTYPFVMRPTVVAPD